MAQTTSYTTIFDMDYFSGSQCMLYVGDVWVDEVTSLEYQVTQSKRPIYGYASQLWDDCAAGQVLVQGSFTINFKEAGYLWAVLRRYFNISATLANIPATNSAQQQGNSRLLAKQTKLNQRGQRAVPGALDNRPLVGSNGTQISRAAIERLVRGEATTAERYRFYNDLAGYATTQTDRPRDKVFEDIMEVFEDQIWGEGVVNDTLLSQLRRPDDNAFDGFDMFVVFGDYATPGANHTVNKIIDVRLTSQGKQITMAGNPIQEQYSFIARATA